MDNSERLSANATRILVRGKVQGVGFREWTRRQAVELGLSGWVRNLHDGGVEACFSGNQDSIEQIIERCWKGPPASSVELVTVFAEPEVAGYADFQIRFD